ncbi:hypothetical protein BHE74_00015247 [Ensete ventricosum]|uniref:Alcohol dehydrogenase-like C-terminal domain-containing protein n=1 Tax=Ensete ventricosum TaxID=4639 RepID=A0A426Z5D8_ENSVE|nr:hypothetical protein B296_00046019 [Ensete ventricosum]RWW76648.1 hypothetical protein BHE74_00015247 [Ensete ventricosum]RZR94077.1 hypothetical protein BHM03_00022697 [Ensete ventricosum]
MEDARLAEGWLSVQGRKVTLLFRVRKDRENASSQCPSIRCYVHGRIAVCGLISQYNLTQREGIYNMTSIVTKRIKMQGFIEPDHKHLYPQFLEAVIQYIRDGKVVYVEDIAEGIEKAPSALIGLFTGRNVGKQVVLVARDR